MATAATSQVTAQSTQEFEENVEQAIHDRINAIRTDRGLQTLAYSKTLEQVADYHSQDMIDENYFAHTAPDGETVGDRYDRYDTSCQTWGENILYNYASNKSPANAAERSVEQWMESDGHRRNILSEMWAIEGIGAQVGSDGRLYVTQNFGAGCQ
ncbi:CAP domain-containing protein [Haladaptatus caseinilyticus]|uniref:CAP domain-containing protein n=1 Tax=Haladaptatus caseinilyticus TaxID=2993314 RepID=UPI00224B951D|nr:CAP domain-containing protein [Haladaptatus caseinilyticus]